MGGGLSESRQTTQAPCDQDRILGIGAPHDAASVHRRPRGGVATQRTANPCTPVRFRARPPSNQRVSDTQAPSKRQVSGSSVFRVAALEHPWSPMSPPQENFAREIGLLRTLAQVFVLRPLHLNPEQFMRRDGFARAIETSRGIVAIPRSGYDSFTQLSEAILDRFPAIERGVKIEKFQTELFGLLADALRPGVDWRMPALSMISPIGDGRSAAPPISGGLLMTDPLPTVISPQGHRRRSPRHHARPRRALKMPRRLFRVRRPTASLGCRTDLFLVWRQSPPRQYDDLVPPRRRPPAPHESVDF
jgi:hypothetical protein